MNRIASAVVAAAVLLAASHEARGRCAVAHGGAHAVIFAPLARTG